MISAYLLLAAVYVAGLFIPLMNNDAGEYSVVALNMAKNNDYINIVRKGEDYLDKPHLLFWLSALSYEVFGVNGFAYKFHSLLFSVIAIFSTTRLASILFNRQTGILAGLVLGFSQAFIIANYDVRTDAILTGATIFSIYQFILFSHNKKYIHIIGGALGLALAVGTKGMIAVIVTGTVIVIHMMYLKRIKEIVNWKWLSSILWFFIFLSPFLFCYYLQFDSHPEKTTNGVKGMSGIKFLLWTQSFERLAGQRNMVNSSDPLFFLHTFLWAFLPWSIIAYYETIRDWIIIIKNKFRITDSVQFCLSGAAVLVMILMSTSKFKLPHYINIIFPLFAIITAKAISRFIEKKRSLPSWVKTFFYVVCIIYIVAGIILNVWAFPMQNILMIICALLACVVLVFLFFKNRYHPLQIFFYTLYTVGIVNFFLNINFFPKVLQYQGSIGMADYFNQNKLPPEKIGSFTSRFYYAFDFYIEKDIPGTDIQQIRQKISNNESFYLLTDHIRKPELLAAGIPFTTIHTVHQFHVSRLNLKFIDPSTRNASLDSLTLLKIN